MRGRVRRSLLGSAIPCLMALLMVTPALALTPEATPALPEGPFPDPAAQDPMRAGEVPQMDPFGWMEGLSVERLESVVPRVAEGFAPFVFPTPDTLPGYAASSEEDQRLAWRTWLLVTVSASVEPDGPFDAASAQTDTITVNATEEDDFGKPRALRALWNLESHGSPRELHAADDAGATFVVTDRSVLKFPAPGAAPSWMVKPGGSLGRTATADANGDGNLDMIIGVNNYYGEDEPSLVVVDGVDGSVLFSGLVGEERLYTWTLTDVDGDGTDDVLGIDGQMRLAAYRLDGNLLYAVPLPELPSPPTVSLPFVYLRMYYQRYSGGGFADVDGDGVEDVVVMNGYSGLFLAVAVFQQVSVPLMTAYSGADGSVLWQAPAARPHAGYSWSYPVATGDINGDGKQDLLLRSVTFTSTVGAFTMEIHSRVHSGVGGTVLSDDGYTVGCVVLVCTPPLPQAEEFMPGTMADLDGDGSAELIGVGGERDWQTGETVLWLEGRTVSPVPGGPSLPLYQHTFLEGTYDIAEVDQVRLRDTDGDGVAEALVAVYTAALGEDGSLASVEIHHYVVDAKGAKGGVMPDLYGFWDFGADGTAHAWSVRDDRWGPLQDDGTRLGEGFRLIVSMAPLAFHDHTGDDVPDMLLRKTLGYMWVDGKSGDLLDDVVRPIEARPQGVYEERGRLFILERDYSRDGFAFLDIETFDEAWRVTSEELENSWIDQLVDVTGDGRLDVVSDRYVFHLDEDTDSGPIASPSYYSVSDERTVKVIDMTTGETVWERELQDAYVQFADAIPQRPGSEILVRARDTDTRARSLALYVIDEEEARWTYNLGTDGWMVHEAAGYLLMRNEQEGVIYEIVSGDSGELIASVPLPADTSAVQVFFTPVNTDRFPELVVSFVEEEGGDDYAVEVLVHDWAEEKELARYTLVGNGEERFRRIESGLYLMVPEVGFASAEVGDWDRDGLVDFAYREADRALVRSTASGEILALAPGAGTILFTPDLNEDGRNEVGMITDRGRLRFFAFAPDVGELAEEDESGIRTVKQVNGTETESGADRFFDDVEQNGLPAPGFGLAMVLLALVAFVLRRRE